MYDDETGDDQAALPTELPGKPTQPAARSVLLPEEQLSCARSECLVQLALEVINPAPSGGYACAMLCVA